MRSIRSTAAVLDKLSRSRRIGELELRFSTGWHEKNDRTKGYFESAWGAPESWDDVILQGPHLFVATPLYKTPNKTMLHNQDWSATDFEALDPDAMPITSYKPRGELATTTTAPTPTGAPRTTRCPPVTITVSLGERWRRTTGERTLIPAIIPPGAAHIHGVISHRRRPQSMRRTARCVGGFMSSLIQISRCGSLPKSLFRAHTVSRLPLADRPLLTL